MSASESDVENKHDEPKTCKRFHDNWSDEEEAGIKKTKVLSEREQKQLFEYHLAVKSNKIDRIDALLKSGIDINDDSIFYAVSTDIGNASLKYLIENDAELYVQQKDTGYTLLHVAAHCSDSTKFKMLIDKNFDVNAKANNNVTPLHLAAWVGNVEIVKMLIERRASINCQTQDLELTPLHLATMEYNMENAYNSIMKIGSRSSSLMSELRYKKLQDRNLVSVIQLLVENGAHINARDTNRNTPLHYAALQSNKNVIEKLLKFGAYVDVMNNEGNLPLHNVLKNFNVDGLTCILEYGADINDISCQFKNVREYESSKANSFYNSVLEHTSKLRAVDLSVAEVYKSEFHKSFWQSHLSECSREVERLKAHIIIDNVSVYDFLHMNVIRRRAYMRHITTLDLEMKFPKYYGILCGSYRQAIARRSLMELSKAIWHHLTEIDLPDVCSERILFFLRNTDLTFFVASAHGF